MDNFGIPTEINVSVMKAIAELQYTDSDCGFVNEKKINDHVVYYKQDKDSLVRQSLDNLTFLGILVQTGSSAFALRHNLQFASGASAIPWITPQKQNGNLKRAAKVKRNSVAKKKRYSPSKIDSLFSYYFEQYKNMKSINNPVNSEVNTGPEDTTNMLHFNALLEDQKSKPLEKILGNVESKLKNTNCKDKRNIEAKKKRYSPKEIDTLFARYFEEYRNMKTTNNSEHFKVLEDTKKMPLNIVLENQKSKPMEEVSKNVDSKLKNTKQKNKRSFEANKKRCSPAEIDSLFAYYFKKYKKIKTINSRDNFVERTPSKLGITGLIDDNNLQLSESLDGQTSNSIEIAVEKVESKRKITMAKEKRNLKTKKKYYYCPEIDSIFANCLEKYRRNITKDNPDLSVSTRDSILGSTGLKVTSNIFPINAFKDKESCWKFTDPLVI